MSYDYDSGAGTFIYRDRAQQALNRAHETPSLNPRVVSTNPAWLCERHPTDPKRRHPSTVIVWRGDAYTLACTSDGELGAALTNAAFDEWELKQGRELDALARQDTSR